MAGLNELISNKEQQTSTLPNWFTNAQQNVVTQTGNVAAPSITGTAAESAIGAFGPTGPFATGANTLNAIGSGAANPWITNTDASGKTTVTPNVNTALGGLFGAQKEYLDTLLPDIDAAASAPAIGAGGFGSKMNLAGITKARGQAAADLFQRQMTSALQNQQTGVSAGAALGNIGNQQVQSGLNTGTWQLNAPYSAPLNQANILSKMNVPTSTEKQVQLSPFNQIAGLGSLVSGGLNSLLGSTVLDKSGNPIRTPGMLEQIKALSQRLGGKGSGSGASIPDISDITQIDTSNLQPGQEGYGWQYFSDGTSISPGGDYYQGGNLVWSPAFDENYWNEGGNSSSGYLDSDTYSGEDWW